MFKTVEPDVYLTAFELVTKIDEDLRRGLRHYRDKAGRLLTELDEVIRAILDDQVELTTPCPENG